MQEKLLFVFSRNITETLEILLSSNIKSRDREDEINHWTNSLVIVWFYEHVIYQVFNLI